jgi:hypothetical protein
VKRLAKFLRDESGAAAVYFALIAPVLVGFAGLGAEATMWLATERKLQHIADVSAFSGAARSVSQPQPTAVRAASKTNAEQSGLRGSDSIVINLPPKDGQYTGQAGYVEVVVSRGVPRALTSLFSAESGPVIISARAVASVQSQSGERVCMLSLRGDFVVGGSGDLTVKDCGLSSNSPSNTSFQMVGGRVSVSGSCLHTVGGVSTTSNLTLTGCSAPLTQQRPSADPYANLTMPDSALVGITRRTANSINGGSVTHTDVLPSFGGVATTVYGGGLTLSGNVSLAPGIYVVDGGSLKVNANTVVSGSGVSFYLMNGATLDVAGGAQLNISAYNAASPQQRPDPFAGILFFSDRSGTPVNHSMSGNSTSAIDGVFYFPNDNMTYTGGSGTAYPCIDILAARLNLSGSGAVVLGCEPSRPVSMPIIRSEQKVALVE